MQKLRVTERLHCRRRVTIGRRRVTADRAGVVRAELESRALLGDLPRFFGRPDEGKYSDEAHDNGDCDDDPGHDHRAGRGWRSKQYKLRDVGHGPAPETVEDVPQP